ncbi:MAG: hypothetical protein PF636_04585 [Actinomycetota bacterium]|jgi:hypothetical protein|nr:hypothetical protein [Actinomycetota bacterium]
MRLFQDLMNALIFAGSLGMLLGFGVVVTAVGTTTMLPFSMFQMLYWSMLITVIGYFGSLITSRIQLDRTTLTW